MRSMAVKPATRTVGGGTSGASHRATDPNENRWALMGPMVVPERPYPSWSRRRVR